MLSTLYKLAIVLMFNFISLPCVFFRMTIAFISGLSLKSLPIYYNAFPRAWRDLILAEASGTAKITNGALALLAAILEEDFGRITLTGDSVTRTARGIPEGSKFGPACFNLIPNTPVTMLSRSGSLSVVRFHVDGLWCAGLCLQQFRNC